MHPKGICSPGGSLARAALLLLLLPSIAHAELDEKGFRVGAVAMGMSRDESGQPQQGSTNLITGPGWTSGGWVTIRKSDVFAIQFEGNISNKRLKTEECNNGCTTTSKLSFYYLELPTVLRLDLLAGATKFYFAAGAEWVVTLGGGETPTGGTFQRNDELFPINFGFLGGIGLQIPAGPGKIAIDVRYKRWLAPINKVEDMVVNDPDPDEKITPSHQASVTVGYAFP